MNAGWKVPHRVLIVISNATISPQLLEIIKCLKSNEVSQVIFIISDNSNPLLAKIRLMDVPLKVLSPTTKYGILSQSLLMFIHLLKHRPSTLLTSGQFATFIGMPSAWLLRINKRVYIRHHSNFHHKYNLRVGLILDRIMNSFSTNIVAVSQIVKNILVQKESVRENKISIIYNGIELNDFRSKFVGVSNRDLQFKIGVISRLTEWKGVAYTARAFQEFVSRYPNSYLHIIGAKADDFDQVTRALEGVPNEKYSIEPLNLNIPEFLQSVNVLVHVPLEIDDEAFGIVYLEALASGTPGIFTISGILNELSNPNLYFSVVPSRDYKAILMEFERHYKGMATYKPIPVDWLEKFDLKHQGLSYLKLILS